MSNCYAICTAETALACNDEEHDILSQLLDAPEDDDNFEAHGFEIERWEDTGHSYIYAEEWCDQHCLPEAFRQALGEILKRLDLPYLEFGIACWSDKPAPGTAGGAAFRIIQDGSMVEPSVTWPEAK